MQLSRTQASGKCLYPRITLLPCPASTATPTATTTTTPATTTTTTTTTIAATPQRVVLPLNDHTTVVGHRSDSSDRDVAVWLKTSMHTLRNSLAESTTTRVLAAATTAFCRKSLTTTTTTTTTTAPTPRRRASVETRETPQMQAETEQVHGKVRLPTADHPHFAQLVNVTQEGARTMMVAAGAVLEASLPSARYPRNTTSRTPAAATTSTTPGTAVAETFKVFQFNMLAEGLSSGGPAVPPFTPTKDGEFGGFSAVPNPTTCLDFDVRKWRLVEEMLSSDADIITFQECDHFADFFQPVMATFGYAGHWVAKGDSPCLQFGYYSDGVGIFYKTAAWEETAHTTTPATTTTNADANTTTGPVTSHYVTAAGKPEGNVYMLLPLVRKSDGEQVLVATTHLKAKIDPEHEARRVLQATQLMEAIRQNQVGHSNRAVVLAADFNTDAYAAESKGTTIPAQCVPAVAACQILALESAYPLQTSEEDQDGTYTTWKKRGAYEAKHTIDYIWHSGSGLECVATLDAVSAADMDEARLPGFRYPSDHLAIAAEFRFPAKLVPVREVNADLYV